MATKSLTESAYLNIFILADHQTSACYSRHFVTTGQRPHVSITPAGKPPHEVVRCAPRSQDNASMLNRAIGIYQKGTHGPYTILLSIQKQMLQPIFLQNFRIVIQQHQVLTTSLGGKNVVKPCKMKFP